MSWSHEPATGGPLLPSILCVYVCMYVLCVYMYVRIMCMYIYIYVCIYIYIHTYIHTYTKLRHCVQTRSWLHSAPCPAGTGNSFPREQQLELEAITQVYYRGTNEWLPLVLSSTSVLCVAYPQEPRFVNSVRSTLRRKFETNRYRLLGEFIVV
jgi:hypothetical protein